MKMAKTGAERALTDCRGKLQEETLTVEFYIIICVGTLAVLVWILRRDRLSVGLPAAYMISLLLIHVPGAYAHLVDNGFLSDDGITESGIGFATVGAVAFVVGVWFARFSKGDVRAHSRPVRSKTFDANQQRFALFCLIGGWLFAFGLSPLHHIPSLGAAISKGGAIWMLGVLLALPVALQNRNRLGICLWIGALLVYPVVGLLFGGFLSYGSAAIIIVGSILTISTRRYWRVLVGIAAAAYFGLTIFVNYFEHRSHIRDEVWGGAPLEARLEAVSDIVSNFHWFDSSNLEDVIALNQRLNQNVFVGLAARRIQDGEVGYLYGRSIWQGIEALIPRAFWPDKPVFAGSPMIVSEMTGLRLSPTTSFGVGNVMEFQINFGLWGVIGGFLILGWLIAILDRRAAVAQIHGEFGRMVLYFLPAIALIDPIGSTVEMASGSAAAIVAAYGWKWVWGNIALPFPSHERTVIYRL